MNLLIRFFRSLPLMIALVALAVILYFLISYLRSPEQAKRALIKMFHILNAAIMVVFLLGSAYALLDKNLFVADLSACFALVGAAGLAITLYCRYLYLKKRPELRQERINRARERKTAWEEAKAGIGVGAVDDGGAGSSAGDSAGGASASSSGSREAGAEDSEESEARGVSSSASARSARLRTLRLKLVAEWWRDYL